MQALCFHLVRDGAWSGSAQLSNLTTRWDFLPPASPSHPIIVGRIAKPLVQSFPSEICSRWPMEATQTQT